MKKISSRVLQKFFVILVVFSLPTSQLTAAMISTERVVSDLSAERDRVQGFLRRGDVQKKLVEFGVSSEEASKRVASLSDAEIQQVAGQIDKAQVGGDGIYLGFGALIIIVLLIYILVRR